MSTTRRAALGALVVGSVWLTAHEARQHLMFSSPNPDYRTLAERLSKLPRRRESLRGIGLAYLESLEHRPTAEQITEAWFPRPEERERAIALEPAALAQDVSNRTLEDYRTGKVVSVRGWMLSETEARFAALVALVRRI